MRWLAASAGVAALPACRPPREAVPYVTRPDGITPGIARHYATAWSFEGWAQPVVATCHVGRPTKLEGNPDHPASRGATDPFTQLAVMGLYDPDRSATIRQGAAIATWDGLMSELVRRQAGWRQGKGLAVLSGASTSPTLMAQMDELAHLYPAFRWHVFEPIGEGYRAQGLAQAFGRPLDLLPRLDRARVWISFDDDGLGPGPWQTWNAGRWADARKRSAITVMVAEPAPSLTGARAEDRLAAGPARVLALLAALAGQTVELAPAETAWLERVRAALDAHPGAALITAGRHLPPEAHAAVAGLNHRYGAPGNTLDYRDALVRPQPGLPELRDAIHGGMVDTLLVLDCNPVYTAPGDLDLAGALAKVPLTIQAGTHRDETAIACRWHLPLRRDFEEWSDGRAVDGTATLIQPLVRPLFAGVSRHRLLAALAGRLDAEPLQLVRRQWQELDDGAWTRALAAGAVPGSAPSAIDPGPPRPLPPLAVPGQGFAAVIRPDVKVWDGRFANLAWAQEIGDPLTKVAWEHTATVAPATALRLGIEDGDHVRVRIGTASVDLPACVLPGQAEDSVGLTLGGGRRRAGTVGTGVGADLVSLRTLAAPFGGPAEAQRTSGRTALARLQTTERMFGHEVAKVVAAPDQRPGGPEPQDSLFEPWPDRGHAWAMAIDLDLCIGCGACTLACQAENNIPSVGRDEVALGRAMHWIRIDRYVTDDAILFQPVPCMHCEKAPCEVGCPVNATVHSSEGINQQVYNRCIGTRTCAAYCPYEVRRFNFYDYAHTEAPSVEAQRNPDVTVRSRGVMEKCTFCIQRIERARIAALAGGGQLDGDTVTPACAQACPTNAIHFGDLNRPQGRMAGLRAHPRHYAMLAELNTRPRTTYLARVRTEPGKT
ncbi:MAG: 4Fe-4S binding protein [Solirubrobacterales bacterium]